MIKIKIAEMAGSFAENKDVAREVRIKKIFPALERKEEITIDFIGVEGTTQSFIHALISEVIRKYGAEILDVITFKNCNTEVQKIISIVADYMQESQ